MPQPHLQPASDDAHSLHCTTRQVTAESGSERRRAARSSRDRSRSFALLSPSLGTRLVTASLIFASGPSSFSSWKSRLPVEESAGPARRLFCGVGRPRLRQLRGVCLYKRTTASSANKSERDGGTRPAAASCLFVDPSGCLEPIPVKTRQRPFRNVWINRTEAGHRGTKRRRKIRGASGRNRGVPRIRAHF